MNFLPLLAETLWKFKHARKATKLLNLTVIQFESKVWERSKKQPADFFLCVRPGSINMNVYSDAPFQPEHTGRSVRGALYIKLWLWHNVGRKSLFISLTGGGHLFHVPSSLECTRHQPTQRDRWSPDPLWRSLTIICLWYSTTWTSPPGERLFPYYFM